MFWYRVFCDTQARFLGIKNAYILYLFKVFYILGVERRENSPSRKENEVAMGEKQRCVRR